MRINFYDAVLSEDDRISLVKEKAVNYGIQKINTPEDVVLMIRTLLHADKKAEEHCYMIALNTAGRVLGISLLSMGTVNASLVTPREFYIRALLMGAVQVILCHNHPSGDPSPSKKDMEVTKQLKDAGDLLGINFVDHIIIGRKTYFSFKEF